MRSMSILLFGMHSQELVSKIGHWGHIFKKLGYAQKRYTSKEYLAEVLGFIIIGAM